MASSSTANKKPRERRKEENKRFLWPLPLDEDFIAAILDVGVKFASMDLLRDYFERESPALLASTLQKLRLFRQRDQNYISFYQRSLREGGNSATSSPRKKSSSSSLSSSNALLEEEEEKKKNYMGALHHQLEVASQTLALQANLSEQIEQNIHSKVSHSRDILSQINSLERQLGIEFTPSSALPDVKPAPEIPIAAPLETFPLASNGTIQGHNGTTSPRGSNSSSITAVVEDVKPANGGSTMSAARQGLTIISEMRSHMNMHRQLLKRKNELMSQFPPPPPAGRDKAGNSMPPRRRMSLKKKKSLEEGEGRVKEESSSSFSSSCMVGSEEVKEEGHHHEEIEQKLQSDLEDDYFNILDLADFASNTEDNGEGGNTSCHFLDFSFHDYLNT